MKWRTEKNSKIRFSSNFNCGKDFFNLPYFPDVYTQQLNLLSIGEICRFKHALVSMVISRLLAIFFFFSALLFVNALFFFFSKTEYYMTIAKTARRTENVPKRIV